MTESVSKRATRNGFTFVEFIVALVLVGIISVSVISRFLDTDAFEGRQVRDQIVALARTAQQSALGRSDVSLTITPDGGGDNVTITASDTGTIASVTTAMSSLTLKGDINVTASCAVNTSGTQITAGSPMTINFGELGNLEISGVTGSTGAVTSALRICINDRDVDSVCVSPSGFAYRGDCDI